MKNLILIIDTAHPTARVMLCKEGSTLSSREWENTPTVGTDLLLFIDELLQEAGKEKSDIARVAVHAGPGSYGVLRSGITTATILAQALGAELAAVSGDTAEELVESAKEATFVDTIEVKYRQNVDNSP